MSNTFTWNLLSDAERSGDSVFILDSHSQIFRYVNDCACQKLGYSRDELLQMGMLDITRLPTKSLSKKLPNK